MSRYHIAAIPTIYRGRKYRSRLEARWAAFFDLLNWKHEYEPFDLGGWSPDFLLQGKVLVEIKPVTTADVATCEKMFNALARLGRYGDSLLLFGVAPQWDDRTSRPQVGWHSPSPLGDDAYPEPDCDHFYADSIEPAFFKVFATAPQPTYDICSTVAPAFGCLSPFMSWYHERSVREHPDDFADFYRTDLLETFDGVGVFGARIMELWAEATNTVQYIAQGGR